MNKTAEAWAACQADAVIGGSPAQAQNVMQMALDDIAAMARRIARLESALRNLYDAAYPPEIQPALGRYHDASEEAIAAWLNAAPPPVHRDPDDARQARIDDGFDEKYGDGGEF